MDERTQQAITILQQGDRSTARHLLTEAIQAHPDDTLAWQHLADAVDSPIERRVCLERLLMLQGEDAMIRDELERMGPPPKPEPSPNQIISAIKQAGATQAVRRIERTYWRWLHVS